MQKLRKETRAVGKVAILKAGGGKRFAFLFLAVSLFALPCSVRADEMQYYAESAGQYHKVEPALIKAVAHVESRGKHYSKDGAVITSPKGAKGRMQLMPGTALEMQVDPLNEWANVYGGTKYLRLMLDRYNGNLPLALAAYNAGPGRVKDRVPNIPETQYYVEAVMYYYSWFKAQVQPVPAAPVVAKKSAPAVVFWVDTY